MYNKKSAATILSLLLLCLLPVAGPAQSTNAGGAADRQDAAARLRAMFFARDFEGGYVEGRKLVQQFPDATGVLVWSILNASRSERGEEALEWAEKGKPADGDGWRLFALAGALNYH